MSGKTQGLPCHQQSTTLLLLPCPWRTLTKQVKRLEPETMSHCPHPMRDVFLPPLRPVWVQAHGSAVASTAAPAREERGVGL